MENLIRVDIYTYRSPQIPPIIIRVADRLYLKSELIGKPKIIRIQEGQIVGGRRLRPPVSRGALPGVLLPDQLDLGIGAGQILVSAIDRARRPRR